MAASGQSAPVLTIVRVSLDASPPRGKCTTRHVPSGHRRANRRFMPDFLCLDFPEAVVFGASKRRPAWLFWWKEP